MPLLLTGMLVLDLAKEVEPVRGFLRMETARYLQRHGSRNVSGVQFFFAMQNGFLDVYFWTQSDYEPFELDGSAAQYRATLKRPSWKRFYREKFVAPTEVVTTHGKAIRTRPDAAKDGTRMCIRGEQVTRAIGAMLADILVEARRGDLFSPLSTSLKLRLAVQDDDDVVWWSK